MKCQLCLLFVLMYFLSTDVEASLCWKKPCCNCYGGENTIIYCRSVRNVSDITALFRKYTPVYKIRITGSFTTLPSRAFDGISVSVISMTAPLSLDIPEDSMQGVRDLQTLILNNTLFERIPDVFSNRRNYQTFILTGGKVSGIETQLQNMSSATEVVLRRNRISLVSEDAFWGSNNVQKLDLSFNELVYLHPNTFKPMQFLEEMRLSHNRLYTLDGCFHTLNPKRIDLHENNLTSVDGVFHKRMWNLRYLNLGSNPGLLVTSSTFPPSLKKVMELHLSHNGMNDVDPALLKNLWYLDKLYLNDNNLTLIPRYFLEHSPFLTTIELSNNHLETLGGILDARRKWYRSLKMNLDGNELTTACVGTARMSIYSMDLSRNRITDIQVKDMMPLEKVVYFNLSSNYISFLEKGCFKNFTSLEYLDLSFNFLKSLNGTLQNIPKLSYINIRSCSLETLTEDEFLGSQKIKTLNLRNNSLSSVDGAFRNLKYINSLDVSENNLTTLTTDSFPPFKKISIRVRILWMTNNSWTCDCRMAWFFSWVNRKGSTLKDNPVCSSPPHLQGVAMRSLNLSDFDTWVDDCPELCECVCKAEGNRMYTEVRCFQKGLKAIPKLLPPNVRLLDLQGNAIASFDAQDISHLEELVNLNLEDNEIEKVRFASSNLTLLRLARNNLRTFPLDEWVSNASVTLSRNPWSCNCDTWAFRNWLVQHNDSVMDLDEVRCGSQESLSLRDKLIVTLTRKDLCSYYLSRIFTISGCAIMFLILCLICVLGYQTIVAYLYSWGCTCLKKSSYDSYPYDAFLMHSEDDENLVLGDLAKNLEDGKRQFYLCIPTRDITTPRTSQKINAYLPQCAKVIVFLTRKFIENQECMHLLVSAMPFSTEHSSQCFIFIKHGDLPPATEMDPVLKTLLRSCVCLTWGQCSFWQKLIYQLPKKRSPNQMGDETDEPLMDR